MVSALNLTTQLGKRKQSTAARQGERVVDGAREEVGV